jgi:hypothetical protein
MQNTYFSIRITSPETLVQDGYQVVDSAGNATLVDMNGALIPLPVVYEYSVTTPIPQSPPWGS